MKIHIGKGFIFSFSLPDLSTHLSTNRMRRDESLSTMGAISMRARQGLGGGGGAFHKYKTSLGTDGELGTQMELFSVFSL